MCLLFVCLLMFLDILDSKGIKKKQLWIRFLKTTQGNEDPKSVCLPLTIGTTSIGHIPPQWHRYKALSPTTHLVFFSWCVTDFSFTIFFLLSFFFKRNLSGWHESIKLHYYWEFITHYMQWCGLNEVYFLNIFLLCGGNTQTGSNLLKNK